MTPRVAPVEVALPSHGVFVLESHHAPGFRMAPSRHDFLEVFYVLHGSGAFAVGRAEYPCRPDDVVVVPPGEPHRIADSPARPLSLYAVCVGPAVANLDPDVAAFPAGRFRPSSLIVPQLRAGLRLMLFEQAHARPGHRAVLVGLALELLGLLCRDRPHRFPAAPVDGPPGDLLATVRAYVADLPQRFFEPTDLDRTAAALGMSRRRFTQLFREVTGVTWLDHLTALRVDYARQLLRATTRSVPGVAFESGFEDLSSFYRAFKKRTGLPPNEWRRTAGSPEHLPGDVDADEVGPRGLEP